MKKKAVKTKETIVERRNFLKGSGLVAVTLGNPVIPWAFQALMHSEAAQAQTSENAFVFVFLRGGADGLSILPPAPGHKDRAAYEAARPNIKLDASDITLLGNTDYALNNACPNLLSLYQDKRASFYHGVGNKSSNSRSHFVQQDYIDRGGVGSQSDGFLNRALSLNGPAASALVASSAGPTLSKSLLGNKAQASNLIVPVQSLDSATGGEVSISNGELSRFQNKFFLGVGLTERLLATWSQTPGSIGKQAADASSILNQAMENVSSMRFGEPSDYGKLTQFRTAAQLLAGCPTVKYLTIDVEGWDTHDQIGAKNNGYFYRLLSSLDKALGAFLKDIEGKRENVRVVIVSEFGRPLHENGTMGLDHGRGGLAITIAPKGSNEGGNIYSRNFSLQRDKLEDERDIAVTIDHREILGHILTEKARLIAVNDLKTIFPQKSESDKVVLNYKF